MTQRQEFLRQVASLEALIETQQAKYDIATKCLADTKAAIAVSKMSAEITANPLSAVEIVEFGHAVSNSVQGVMDAAASLGTMRRELMSLRDSLLMLPE